MPINVQNQERGAMPLTPIFFLIDTSGSMSGQPIEAVNTAMREAIPEVQKFTQENADVAVRYSVLEFSTGAKWMNTTPGYVEDFKWIDLQASGLTALGEAYKMLNDKLSRKNGFLQEHANNAPIIILLTDGAPTDDAASGLALLKENKWFKQSIRIAMELPGSTHSTLVDFAGGEEGVIPTDPEKLKQYLKIIAINSATIGSQSQGRSAKSVTNEIIKPVNPEPVSPTPEPIDDSEEGGDDDPFKDIFD